MLCPMKPPPNESTAKRADSLATMGRPRGESTDRLAGPGPGSTSPDKDEYRTAPRSPEIMYPTKSGEYPMYLGSPARSAPAADAPYPTRLYTLNDKVR